MGGEARYVKNGDFFYKYSFPYHVFYEDKVKVENNKAYYYMFSDVAVDSYDGSAQRFYGSPDHTEIPAAVLNGGCSNIDGEGEKEFIGAFEHKIGLAPGMAKTVNIVIGVSRSLEQVQGFKKKFDTAEKVETAFGEICRVWDKRCATYHIETPDRDFDNLINYWVKKQAILLTRLNRMSAYCPARNQLQDALGYSLIDPQQALEYGLAYFGGSKKMVFCNNGT
jgi:cellobiose phosphorylase/cellobionic acid phosphorylase